MARTTTAPATPTHLLVQHERYALIHIAAIAGEGFADTTVCTLPTQGWRRFRPTRTNMITHPPRVCTAGCSAHPAWDATWTAALDRPGLRGL